MSRIESLWKYCQAEQEVARIDARIKSTPNRARLNKLHGFLTEQQNLVSTITKQIEAKGAAITRLGALLDELERQYELETSELATMQNDEECTAAEMSEARRAMESLMNQITSARKEITDTITYLEKASAEYRETYTKAGKAKKEYDAVRAACEQESAKAKPERDKALAEAERLRSNIDPALLKKYNAIRTHHAQPMAKVESNQCSGCRMSLPTSIIKKVSTGDGIIECENCGRILFSE